MSEKVEDLLMHCGGRSWEDAAALVWGGVQKPSCSFLQGELPQSGGIRCSQRLLHPQDLGNKPTRV